MEPFRNTIPEMFDAAEEMGIRFYGAPYLFSTSDAKAVPTAWCITRATMARPI
jgi:hypothetical protein